MLREDARLGACRVILGQLGDRGEQACAQRIVEILRRDEGRRRRQAMQEFGSDAGSIVSGEGIDLEELGCSHGEGQ